MASQERQLVERVVSAAFTSGGLGELFSLTTLEAASRVATETEYRRFGRTRSDAHAIAVLATWSLLRNIAGRRTSDVDLLAGAALSALLVPVAPARIPEPVRDLAVAVADLAGPDLALVRPQLLATAIVDAARTGLDVPQFVASAWIAVLLAEGPSTSVDAMRRFLECTQQVIETGAVAPGQAPAPAPATTGSRPAPRSDLEAWDLAQQGLQLFGRYETTGRLGDLKEGIALVRTALTGMTDPDLAAPSQGNLATALSRLHKRTQDPAVLDEVIELYRSAVAWPGMSALDRTHWLHDLAHALRTRYDATADPADLDAAVDTAKAMLDAGFRPDPNIWAAWRSELATLIGDRLELGFDRPGAAVDADLQVALCRDIVRQAPPGYPDRAGLWSNLGNALATRSQVASVAGRAGPAVEDAAEAIEHHRTAVRLMPARHEYAMRIVGNLSRSLLLHARLTGDRAELAEAVGTARGAARLAGSDPDLNRAAHSLFVSTAMEAAEEGDDPALTTLLVEALELALADRPPPIDPATAHQVLGLALRGRYNRNGDPDDLDRAIQELRTGLAFTPDSTPGDQLSVVRLALAVVLRQRYQLAGRETDLTEAVTVVRAEQAAAGTVAARADAMGLLSSLLQLTAARTGNVALLAEGIDVARQALALAPPGADGDRIRLSVQADLGIGLRLRYEEIRELADLDEAIELARAVVSAPSRAPRPGGADSDHAGDRFRLGVGLQIRYRHTGEEADLDEAIEQCRAAVAEAPAGDPERGGYLSSLGLALQLRHEAQQRRDDLDEAVRVGREALEVTLPGTAAHRARLANVGLAHRIRGELTGDTEDLDEAVRLGRESVADPHPGQALLANNLLNLGRALNVRAASTGAAQDRLEAVEHWRRAAAIPAAARQSRIGAAVSWAAAAAEAGDWASAADGYESAVDLVELVVWHGLPRATREERLTALPGLAAEAAAAALSAGDPERALGLLERGRSVLWTQQLHLRDALDEVRDAAPQLYRRLTELAAHLDRPAAPPAGEVGTPSERRQRLAQQWDDALAEVRALPGLAGVLRPRPPANLLDVAADGPVVVINVSRYRCDALLVTRAGISVLPLPDVTETAVREQALVHLAALEAVAAAVDAGDARIAAGLDWLAERIVDPVLAELTRLGELPGTTDDDEDHDGDVPRVWWCPTGLLTLLPLHAAGIDRVAGSYTPTLGALRSARTARAGADPGAGPEVQERLLVVAVPDAATGPGLPELARVPGALEEADLLAARFPGRLTLRSGPDATREQIRQDLTDHPYAHFACHGGQDRRDPSNAALYLSDGPMPVLALAQLRLDGELAFLSACESAAGGVMLADESIHLAAAVQVAGYRHVVATLWPIADALAPGFTDAVYQELAPAGRIEPARTGRALRAAVCELRSLVPDRPSLWASYAHFGP